MTYDNYQDYLDRKRRQYGKQFDSSDLGEQFIPYYGTGKRIEVTTTYDNGETRVRRGTVGVTTGWKPVFLLMSRVNCSGSSDVLRKSDRVTAVIRYGKRVSQ